MLPPVSKPTLDAILAVQLTVAWAGEGCCSPARLGWWETDLVDAAGGGDLMARLLPRTHVWAALEAVREAARLTDARLRGKLAHPDRLRTLYFLGFELDEQLADRLASHKQHGAAPSDALPLPFPLASDFSRPKLQTALERDDGAFSTVPGGRQLKGRLPDSPGEVARRLAAALVPLADHYPLPFFKLEG